MAQMMTLGATAPGGICLAIPSYGGMTPVAAFALAASMRALTEAQIPHDLIILAGNCHVDDARNALVREFLKGDSEYLMFIDSDLSWAPGDLVKMAKSKRDVIGGIYPHKKDELSFPIRHLPKDLLIAESDGALEVDAVPGGFLRISRNALERLAKLSKAFKEHVDDTELTPKIFERRIIGTTQYSSDYVFCHKWRELGESVYIDPEIHFTHCGEKEWTGCYGAYLRKLNNLPMRGIALISMGIETPHDLKQLHEEWGNGIYAAPVEMVQAAIEIARSISGNVLEIGTGLTTLAMAAANPDLQIHSLESDMGWYQRMQDECVKHNLTNVKLYYSPIVNGWHETVPNINADLVLIDGPPRIKADRMKALDHISLDGLVLIDDMTDAWREKLSAMGRTFNEVGRFALVGRPLQKAA